VRWFEYGAFQPNFRSHESRPQNEVWSYGGQAEPMLEKYLRLRYELMPYIYSLAHGTHEDGAPLCVGCLWTFCPAGRAPLRVARSLRGGYTLFGGDFAFVLPLVGIEMVRLSAMTSAVVLVELIGSKMFARWATGSVQGGSPLWDRLRFRRG
jgi:hypothetical protein